MMKRIPKFTHGGSIESHADALKRKGYMDGGAQHCDETARSKEVKGGLAMTKAKAKGKR